MKDRKPRQPDLPFRGADIVVAQQSRQIVVGRGFGACVIQGDSVRKFGEWLIEIADWYDAKFKYENEQIALKKREQMRARRAKRIDASCTKTSEPLESETAKTQK